MQDVSLARSRSGTRLAYVVTKLKGTVSRPYTIWDKVTGLKTEMRKEPAGYMVYFPRGHVTRIRTKADLEFHGLKEGEAPMINLSGLNDPQSAIGQLLMAQDDEARHRAFTNMEDQVIRLATAKTGNVLMPEQVGHGFRLPESESQKETA